MNVLKNVVSPHNTRFNKSQVLSLAVSKEGDMDGKFKALVHFMVHECTDNPAKLGTVRLNKALWFTDKFAYQMIGESVTSERYVKRQFGPVPKTILGTLKELREEGKIMIREGKEYFDTRKYISLADPDLTLLSQGDRLLAASVLERVCDSTTTEISDFSHDEVWLAASEGEELPLYATLASGHGVITDDAITWAEGIVQEIEAGAA